MADEITGDELIEVAQSANRDGDGFTEEGLRAVYEAGKRAGREQMSKELREQRAEDRFIENWGAF